jgi:serine/threonine protein kinase
MASGDSAREDEAPSTRWDLAEGDEIVPGRLALRLLGRGHLYETYLAWDDRLFSIVVAKVVRRDRLDDTDSMDAFRSEDEVLAKLSHPMLVRSFGSVVDGPRPHLVLEHLEGPSLETLIRKYAPLPLEQILPLAIDLCSVLHYMEAEEILHLDVKPGNVIMSAAPKLVDLSLATPIERARRFSGPVGTEGYMAPEQIDQELRPTLGPGTDVWGLGMTVYEALTGDSPFPEGSNPSDPLPPAPLPRGVPPEVAEALLRCLHPNVTARPRASELALALRPAVEELSGRRVIRRGRGKP